MSTAAAHRPLIAITLGDPAGIGPEVIVKALADEKLRSLGRFVIFGLHDLMDYAADRAEITPYWFRMPHEDVQRVETGVVVADYDEYGLFSPNLKRATAEGGHASMRFLDDAIAATALGRYDALVTGPINKTSWHMAGYRFPGHTELLSDRLHAKRVTMMFVSGRLRVALASVHESIFDLRHSFTIGKVFQPIDLLGQALREWFGIERPRIAVCGLNPHAGENGRFGDEESRIIEPAMVMARELGLEVEGPFPADTLFYQVVHSRRYDGVVAMYHDQGLIPVKLHGFDRAVNVTLGLPIIRTSVDHGTAYDIVGLNKARPGSMVEALRLAIQLSNKKRQLLSNTPPPLESYVHQQLPIKDTSNQG
ncbi:MAG: D-threonate 4-phosphate dehydrogenase [Phycisphaerae bacterium]|nr:D-threonate 4-phosphate dehydrogenase [Phycisphaerae bacterium]